MSEEERERERENVETIASGLSRSQVKSIKGAAHVGSFLSTDLAALPVKKKAKTKGDAKKEKKERERERMRGKTKSFSDLGESEGDSEDESEEEESDSDEMEEWEKKPRQMKEKRERDTALPTKNLDGSVKKGAVKKQKVEKRRESKEEGEEEEEEEERERERENEKKKRDAKKSSSLSPAEMKRRLERRRRKIKEEMASLAENILSFPEKNINQLRDLHAYIEDDDVVVRRLAMVAETEVVREILPGYRVRLPTEDELRMSVSKEVKLTRRFEASLLNGYGRLLGSLRGVCDEAYGRNKKKRERHHPKTALVSLKCLCRLLNTAFHFNQRKDLVSSISPLLDHNNKEVREVVFACLKELFKADSFGDTTLEVIKILSGLVKHRGIRVRKELVEVFLYLPISETILSTEVKDNPLFNNKRGRKTLDDPTLERDLDEASAEVSLSHKKRVQTEMLSVMFTVYFRILKHQSASPTLPIVLRGLARYSHLINLSLVLDLLEFLKGLLASGLNIESTLNCTLAAMDTLAAHSGAITIDVKEFYASLYQRMLELSLPSNHRHIFVLLKCIHVMFKKRQQLSQDRVAAFAQRLAVLSLSVPSHASLAIMHSIRLLMVQYPRVQQLLENDGTLLSAFNPSLDDPDHSNASMSTMWQLYMHQASSHPFVSNYASSLITWTEIPGIARITSNELFTHYDCSKGDFNPAIPHPKVESKTREKKLKLRRRIAVKKAKQPTTYSSFMQDVWSAHYGVDL